MVGLVSMLGGSVAWFWCYVLVGLFAAFLDFGLCLFCLVCFMWLLFVVGLCLFWLYGDLVWVLFWCCFWFDFVACICLCALLAIAFACCLQFVCVSRDWDLFVFDCCLLNTCYSRCLLVLDWFSGCLFLVFGLLFCFCFGVCIFVCEVCFYAVLVWIFEFACVLDFWVLWFTLLAGFLGIVAFAVWV